MNILTFERKKNLLKIGKQTPQAKKTDYLQAL